MVNPAALWYFESVNLYNILCPHKVKKMGDKHEFLQVGKDQFVYMQDDSCTHIYLIVEGRIKLGHYLDDGKDVVTAILSTGEVFGELALAGEEKRRDYAQALCHTVICPLSISELQELMAINKDLSFKILKLVGLRLIKLERKLELLVFRDARTRVVEFLKDAASWKGKKVGYETMIPTRLTHKDIAALTGTSRQTVTTILNELKEQNLINFDRKKILIRNLENLK
jgi:CRP/FNR family transcriptional regulator, cyclic AMP receptor protein